MNPPNFMQGGKRAQVSRIPKRERDRACPYTAATNHQGILLDSGSRYCTIPDAAREAGVSAEKIRQAVREGRLLAYWTGRLRRVRLSDVQRAMGGESE